MQNVVVARQACEICHQRKAGALGIDVISWLKVGERSATTYYGIEQTWQSQASEAWWFCRDCVQKRQRKARALQLFGGAGASVFGLLASGFDGSLDDFQ